MHDGLDEINEDPGGPGVLGRLERGISLRLADVFHRLSCGFHLSFTASGAQKHVIGDLTETANVQKNDILGAIVEKRSCTFDGELENVFRICIRT